LPSRHGRSAEGEHEPRDRHARDPDAGAGQALRRHLGQIPQRRRAVTPPGEPSDAALASRAAAGDERAFAGLVRRHKEPLYRLLRRYTGDRDEAYEAAHEAFIAAWAKMDRYDPARPFGAWLRTIAINKARDRTRRNAFRHFFF